MDHNEEETKDPNPLMPIISEISTSTSMFEQKPLSDEPALLQSQVERGQQQRSNKLPERRMQKQTEFKSKMTTISERFANCYDSEFESLNEWIEYLEEEEVIVAEKFDKIALENTSFSKKVQARLSEQKREIRH